MMKQCAWCLRLIDSTGERVSVMPLPKLYEASHGICGVCGTLWMEQVMEPSGGQAEQDGPRWQHSPDGSSYGERKRIDAEEVTRMILELQQQQRSSGKQRTRTTQGVLSELDGPLGII